MYKEVSKPKINPFLALIAVIVLIFAVMTLSNNFIYPHSKMLADTVNMLFFGFSVYFYMRFFVNSFEYRFENNSFSVTRLGNKNNPQLLFSVTALDIKNFGPYTKKAKNGSLLNYCGDFKKNNRYSFNVNINDKDYTVVFQPSKKLIDMINEVTA